MLAELRARLGIAIVGGLFMSQLLTMFTTPVIYPALDRFTKTGRARRKAQKGRPPVAASGVIAAT